MPAADLPPGGTADICAGRCRGNANPQEVATESHDREAASTDPQQPLREIEPHRFTAQLSWPAELTPIREAGFSESTSEHPPRLQATTQ